MIQSARGSRSRRLRGAFLKGLERLGANSGIRHGARELIACPNELRFKALFFRRRQWPVPERHRRNRLPPSISVILPTHNAAPFVTRAIDSVLNQEGGHELELI